MARGWITIFMKKIFESWKNITISLTIVLASNINCVWKDNVVFMPFAIIHASIFFLF